MLKAELCAACDFSRYLGHNTANAAGFHQWALDSITIVLHHSEIDSDLTDIYIKENLQVYNSNVNNNTVKLTFYRVTEQQVEQFQYFSG